MTLIELRSNLNKGRVYVYTHTLLLRTKIFNKYTRVCTHTYMFVSRFHRYMRNYVWVYFSKIRLYTSMSGMSFHTKEN